MTNFEPRRPGIIPLNDGKFLEEYRFHGDDGVVEVSIMPKDGEESTTFYADARETHGNGLDAVPINCEVVPPCLDPDKRDALAAQLAGVALTTHASLRGVNAPGHEVILLAGQPQS